MKIKFLTPILHPNVSKDGNMCPSIFNYEWTPALTLFQGNCITPVIVAIHELLVRPCYAEPLNKEITDLYLKNKQQYLNEVSSHAKANAYV